MPQGATVPPTIPEETRKMVLCVPDSPEWIALVTGCLVQLKFGWYYDKASGDWQAARDRSAQMYFEFQDQNGLCDVIDCEEVADCIETSESVQNAIGALIQEFGGNAKGRPLPPALIGAPLSNPNEVCDLNALYGSAVNIVQVANRQIEDFLEQIEALTNNQEALAYALSFIPFIGDLAPVPELTSMIERTREWLAEAYVAGYDLGTETEFVCDLFCLGNAGCEITMEMARDYFFDRARTNEGFEDAFETATTLIAALANWNEAAGETVVEIMFGAAFGFMNFLNSMFGMDFAAFVLQTRAGLPNDDWVFLCSECAPVEVCFAADSNYMVLISGEWRNGYPDLNYAQSATLGAQIDMRLILPEAMEFVSWEIERQALESGTTTLTQSLTLWLAGVQVATLYSAAVGSGGYIWQTFGGINGAGTDFDEARMTYQHLSKTAQARMTICASPA